MTWYKFDIWYQFMAVSGIFYHEQGFDEFWKPGGPTRPGRTAVTPPPPLGPKPPRLNVANKLARL